MGFFKSLLEVSKKLVTQSRKILEMVAIEQSINELQLVFNIEKILV